MELSSLGRQRPHIKTRTIPAWQMQLFIRLFLRAYPRLSVFQLPYQISPATYNAVLSGGKGKLVFTTISCDYLLVGQGGGGGGSQASAAGGAGAGAGDCVPGTDILTAGASYPVVIGTSTNKGVGNNGTNGVSSTFNGHTAIGGGWGAGLTGGSNGGNGASGGGSNYYGYTPGTATGLYGHNGGQGTNSFPATGGGGGGSPLAVGGAGTSTTVGVGGAGYTSLITGNVYGRGGDGGYYGLATNGIDGVNPGDGGYGANPSASVSKNGGNGYAGIFEIRYLTSAVNFDGSGGTITHVGGYTIHTFTSSGTFIAPT